MAEHNHGHGHHGNLTEEQQKAIIQQEINLMNNMKHIKTKIAVMSGKGGVGKSTVAANLAEAFQSQGFKTGILDVDIHGPNIPIILGVEDEIVPIEDNKMVPVKTKSGIEVMSMAFLLDSQDTPIIWRGPQKSGTIKQLLADVKWGNLDVLIIDNPPGTGDEPLTVLQTIPDVDGVVMVTTPNSVSREDVLKCVKMVKMLEIENVGLVENMAYYSCPHCGEKINIFGESDGENFAKLMDIKYLGDLPLTEKVSEAVDVGEAIILNNKEMSKSFAKMVKTINKEFTNL